MLCSSWTNKLIKAKDHASVQINIGHLDKNGVYDNTFTTFALAGNVRAMVSRQSRTGTSTEMLQLLHDGSGQTLFSISCLALSHESSVVNLDLGFAGQRRQWNRHPVEEEECSAEARIVSGGCCLWFLL